MPLVRFHPEVRRCLLTILPRAKALQSATRRREGDSPAAFEASILCCVSASTGANVGAGPLLCKAVASVPEGFGASPESGVLEGSHAFSSIAALAAIIIDRFILLWVKRSISLCTPTTNNQNHRRFNGMRGSNHFLCRGNGSLHLVNFLMVILGKTVRQSITRSGTLQERPQRPGRAQLRDTLSWRMVTSQRSPPGCELEGRVQSPRPLLS